MDGAKGVCVCVLLNTWTLLRVLLTNGGQCGNGQLHTGAVVQRASVGAGADGSAGAQQTQPLALLPVAGVGHWQPQRAMGKRWVGLENKEGEKKTTTKTQSYIWHDLQFYIGKLFHCL